MARPQARGGQPGRQPVDRHDPARVEDLGALLGDRLELRVVERQLPAEALDLARDDDLAADLEPAIDVAAAEPGRVDRAGLVLEPGDRPLDPPPERRFDADLRDPDARRHDRPGLGPDEVAQPLHLAQVVVAAGQVEQQVADVVEPEADARLAGAWPRRRARTRPSGVESSATGSTGGGRVGADALGTYSAEMR